MNKKLLALSFVAASVLAACGNDSSTSSNGDDDYKREFATSISTGETMFIGTMSLDHTDDLGKDFVEVGTRAGVVYYDNALFIADLDVGSISRYSLAENNKLGKKEAVLSLPGKWSDHIYFVNKEKAYVGGLMDSLLIINPKTMKITGAIDLVSDGDKCYVIRNGRPEMGKITGTGCQLSALTTAYVVANPDNKLEAAAAAVCTMGLAGEIGWSRMQDGDGNSTYRNRIIDAIFNMDAETLNKGAKYEIR